MRIGTTDPPQTFPPSKRLVVQKAEHVAVTSLGTFVGLLEAQDLEAAVIEPQRHKLPIIGSEEHDVVYSARMGFKSKKTRDLAAVKLRLLFPGRHVFARNPSPNVNFLSLNIVHKVVPLLLLSATDVELPDDETEEIVAWLYFWVWIFVSGWLVGWWLVGWLVGGWLPGWWLVFEAGPRCGWL